MTDPLPPFFAHRFGREYGPDSSSKALERALAGAVPGLETDCCLTADARIVLVHDPRLELATTTAGWAIERDSKDIRAALLRDHGGAPSDQHPLDLADLLDRLNRYEGVVQFEVKSYADAALAVATARRVCELLAEQTVLAREQVEVISFWPAACELAASRGFRVRPIVACAYEPEALARWAADHRIEGIILEGAYFAHGVIDACRERGVSVMSGVVNELGLLERVLAFDPVAVATDRPFELRAESEGANA